MELPGDVPSAPVPSPDAAATPGTDAPVETFELPEGEHAVAFGCAGPLMAPVRARITLQPPESHAMPGAR